MIVFCSTLCKSNIQKDKTDSMPVEVSPLQMREHVGYGPRSGGGMAVRI